MNAQFIIYSEAFTNGQNYCPGDSQYDNWTTFRDTLGDTNFRFTSCTIRGSLDSVGITCTTDSIVAQIANALNQGIEQSFTCDGIIWKVGTSCNTSCAVAGEDVEINAANTGDDCSCSASHTVRPCIGNSNWGGISATTCSAPSQTMEVEFMFSSKFDASVKSIDGFEPPFCSITNDLYITLQQSGTDTLRTVNFGWSVNGNVQSIVNWNGLLTYNEIEDSIFLGNNSFNTGDTIVVWVDNPTAILDSNNRNDILQLIVPPTSLSGTYTINHNIPTGGNNFNSFTDAINMLDSVFVCDTVIFNVSAGTYNEQIIISDIIGADSTSPIIFRGDMNDSTAVILDFTVNLATEPNYTLQLSDAKWVGFEGITFQASGTNFGRVVELTGESANNWFINSRLVGDNTSIFQNSMALLYSENAVSNNITFKNTSFIGGSYSVYWEGTPFDTTSDCSFTNCSFTNWYHKGNYFENVNNISIDNCTFSSNSSFSSTTFGLDLFNCDEGIKISNNKVLRQSIDGAPSRGIQIVDCNASSTNRGSITNNTITVGDSTNTTHKYVSLHMQGSNYFDIFHNTLISYGGRNSAPSDLIATLIFNGVTNNQNNIYNNNICNLGNNNYAVIFGTISSTITSDNNNIFSPSTDLGYYVPSSTTALTLQNWQNTTFTDSNSISVNPNFYDWVNNDLHVCNDSLDNAGKAIFTVTTDFEGDVRNVNTPDIGADEFITPNSSIFNADTLYACLGDSITISGNNYGFNNMWNTGDSTVSITVSSSSTWHVTASNQCGSVSDSIITIFYSPILSFSKTDVTCTGENNGTTTVSVNGGFAPYNYLWSTNDTSTSLTLLSPGIYSLTVTDSLGCSNKDSITIQEPAILNVTADIDNHVTCSGTLGAATANVTGGTTPYNYLWSNNAITSSIDQLTDGDYTIVITDKNGCEATDSITIIDSTCLGIRKNIDFSTKYYPNPTKGAVQLKLNGPEKGDFVIQIINPLGEKLSSENIIKKKEEILVNFDLSDLPNGLYYISIQGKNLAQALPISLKK